MQVTALQVIFDLLHLFGLEFFQTPESANTEENCSEAGDSSKRGDQESSEQDFEKSGTEETAESEVNNVANSLVNILSGLLDNEVSFNEMHQVMVTIILLHYLLHARTLCFQIES